MDQQCKISVIVPVYNVEPWLRECLESVLLHQDLDDIEVICIDDGSTDASLQILNGFAEKDSRVKVYTQSNSGLSATRNRGIELASGEYILFLDSDDLIAENSFLYLYNEVTNNDLDVLYFDAGLIFDNEILEEKYKKNETYYIKNNDYSDVITGRELFVKIINNNEFSAPVWLYLIKHSFLKESNIKFYEGIFHEDELFTPELMLNAEKVSHRNRKVYIRRYREGSIMTNLITIKNVKETLIAAIKLTKYLEIYKDYDDIYNVIERKINSLLSNTIYRFNQCSDEEKWKINQLSEEENKFFQLACLKAGISVQRDIKISVIVPIYNVEEYIRECLDSIVNQTLKDIEIILVDDCSTDNSGKIADEYASKDERITVIHKEKNESLLLARKTGVARAQGKYIMFVNSDDFLSSRDSLKIAYDLIENKDVDIMQFTSDVHDNNNESRENMLKYVNRNVGKIMKSKNIISICFFEMKFPWNLWNKIYKTDICKRGNSYIEDIYINSATDMYAFFLMAFFTNSFNSIETSPLYTYRKSRISISKENTLNIKDFHQINNSKTIAKLLKNFLRIVYSYYEYRDILKKIELYLLRYSIEYGFNKVITTDTDEAFSSLMHENSIDDVISSLWIVYRWREAELAKKLYGIESIKVTKSEIKTIGIFYHRYSQGGIQRGISIRIPMFLKMGYQVVFFTDEYNPELEYDIPGGG